MTAVVDTIKGDDNGDIWLHLDLSDEHAMYASDDWTSLDLDGMRAPRDKCNELIAQVEAHDAALVAAADEADDADGP